MHPEGLVGKLKDLLKQQSPCPHTKDYPGCLFPEIHELDDRVDIYKATRLDPSDDAERSAWLTRLQDWCEEGREILHDHPDEVGANLLDLALQKEGWSGWTLRRRTTEVLNVMGDVVDNLYPPVRGRRSRLTFRREGNGAKPSVILAETRGGCDEDTFVCRCGKYRGHASACARHQGGGR